MNAPFPQQRGPSAYRIREIELPITGSAGAIVNGAPFTFIWPKPVIVKGIFIAGSIAGEGMTDAACSYAGFQIQDQNDINVFTDGFQPWPGESHAIIGSGRRWFPLSKTVFNLDRWYITPCNTSQSGAITITPYMYVMFQNDPS